MYLFSKAPLKKYHLLYEPRCALQSDYTLHHHHRRLGFDSIDDALHSSRRLRHRRHRLRQEDLIQYVWMLLWL